MTLPYLSRLLCIGLASFFVIHFFASLAVAFLAPGAIRAAQALSPRQASRRLLSLRLFPFGLAISVVFGLCVPSYFFFEPERTNERVGAACLFLALMGCVLCVSAFSRGIRAVTASHLFSKRCRRTGRETALAGDCARAIVIEGSAPFLALAGILHPRLIISEGVVKALSEEELSAALGHERAHERLRDNLKRLSIFLTPGIFPRFHGFRELERSWIKFAEFAADEEAVAGDARRSLALASALVQVARLGSASRLTPVAVSFLEDASDLSARVDRLLLTSATACSTRHVSWRTVGSVAILAGCFAPLVFKPSTFQLVQSILEHLVH